VVAGEPAEVVASPAGDAELPTEVIALPASGAEESMEAAASLAATEERPTEVIALPAVVAEEPVEAVALPAAELPTEVIAPAAAEPAAVEPVAAEPAVVVLAKPTDAAPGGALAALNQALAAPASSDAAATGSVADESTVADEGAISGASAVSSESGADGGGAPGDVVAEHVLPATGQQDAVAPAAVDQEAAPAGGPALVTDVPLWGGDTPEQAEAVAPAETNGTPAADAFTAVLTPGIPLQRTEPPAVPGTVPAVPAGTAPGGDARSDAAAVPAVEERSTDVVVHAAWPLVPDPALRPVDALADAPADEPGDPWDSPEDSWDAPAAAEPPTEVLATPAGPPADHAAPDVLPWLRAASDGSAERPGDGATGLSADPSARGDRRSDRRVLALIGGAVLLLILLGIGGVLLSGALDGDGRRPAQVNVTTSTSDSGVSSGPSAGASPSGEPSGEPSAEPSVDGSAAPGDGGKTPTKRPSTVPSPTRTLPGIGDPLPPFPTMPSFPSPPKFPS
jgi:nicotinate-nucleotide--dimethylbenzimidazole phosphoribosyltransferase